MRLLFVEICNRGIFACRDRGTLQRLTDYGPQPCFPYYNVTIRHREGSPYPKLVTCDRYVGLKNLRKGNGIQNTTQKTKVPAIRFLLKSGIEKRRT